MAATFRNPGLTCVCANRIRAQAGVHDAFVEGLAARVAALTVGDGRAVGVAIGPPVNGATRARAEDPIADACAHGATVATGDARHPLGGTFFQPTVLSAVTPAMKIAREETFGPVAPVWRFETEDEVVGVNAGLISTEVAPFGGVKQSGLGREGSHHGIEDYLEIKYMCLGV